MWKKSFNFNRYADGNPMLILFTPLNPLYEQLPSYALLREVAMEYYNCKNNTSNQWTSELIKLQQVKRLLYQKKNFLKFCQDYKIKKPVKKPSPQYRKAVISHNNKYPWINDTQKNPKTGMVNFLLKQGMAISKFIESSNDNSALWSTLGFLENCGESSSQSLPAEKSFYEKYERCQSFEEQLNNDLEMEQEDVQTTMLPYDDDPLSAENLWHDNVKHFCRRMQFANKISPPVAPSKLTSGNVSHIHGLSCDTNYTLYIIAVDSLRNYHFAEALGVDIKNKKDMTAVVILDSKVTLVALCGGGCRALVSLALVHATRVLRACGVRVQAARIDALRHDLPWQYTAHAHPTILVFPSHRGGEAESRAFPSSERVSGSGVVALALRSLGAPTHLRVSLALCRHPKLSSEKTACLKDMRDLVTTAISRNLKYWRRTEVKELRDSLFGRLQHLHDVALHLSLFHITDLKQNNEKQKTLLQSLDILSKNWDIDESLLRRNAKPTPITR
ncbi:jg10784 [Pararge aegeria aegeria]|uniref:Jg10784 protein n=1 Tax=Pararge aegeria aegeria TaxID=348720 RepID=A0A8S4SFC6_9NEOP|nr:jg10784 [Pararge aegeria aegeria]